MLAGRYHRPMLSLIACVPLVSMGWSAPANQTPTEGSFAAGDSTTLWVGRRQVVAIELPEAASDDLEWTLESSDPELVQPLGPAVVLAGQRYGTAAVFVQGSGQCTLQFGAASLEVTCRPPDVEAAARRCVPKFVAPAEGAVLAGICAIGVELTGAHGPSENAIPVLEVPGVGDVMATREVAPGGGPERRWIFEVDAGAMPEGPQLLTLRLDTADTARTEPQEAPKPLLVQVVHSEESISLEAEAGLAVPRPDGFGDAQPKVVGDEQAQGGVAVVMRGYGPGALFHADVPESGRWQVLARVRGHIGAGAFPSVAVSVDTENPRLGAVRILSTDWHRLPVGAPVQLEAGARTLSLRLANPINEGRAERRDLYVDAMELVRAADAPAESASTMSMEMSTMASAPSMGSASMMGTSSAESTTLPDGLWIGLQNVFDGLPMNGDLRIEGLATWRGGQGVPAPRVALLVNGVARGVVQSSEPVFDLSRDELGAGTHTIQLRAEQAGGRAAVTPAQTVTVGGRTGPLRGAVVQRFATQDARWNADGSLPHPMEVVTASLELPAAMEGRYLVKLDARGPGVPHHGRVEVRIEGAAANGGERPLLAEKTLEVSNWWSERTVAEVDLPAGPKHVTLQANPLPDGAASNASQLFLRALVMERVEHSSAPDYSPPGASIVYPLEGATIDPELDAVVADVFDDRTVNAAELIVDGRVVGAFGRVPQGVGFPVLPLFSRDLRPGVHRLQVRTFDKAGNEAESEPREVVVPEASEAAGPGRFKRAVHLLNRFGFGPDPVQLARVLMLGELAWVESQFMESQGHAAARGRARATLGGKIPYAAPQLALRVALSSDQPLRARFALFLDNHFSTWSGKTGAPSEWGDHRRYQDIGLAPFRELLHTALSSPVMLVYLDQEKSFRGRLNENLARELLELHTVGVNGGYTQQEVTALASLLCGVTVAHEAPPDGSGQYLSRVFRFAPDLADPAAQTVLGARFDEAHGAAETFARYGAVLDHLAAHPMTARFWANKLCEHFVSVPAPPALVDDLTQRFLSSGGDTQELLRCIARHPDFWAAMDEPRIASPLDFGLRFGRATAPRHMHDVVGTMLASAGMGLFDHAAPDGYPEEDEAWVDSNGLLARWRLAQSVPWAARVLVPEEVRRTDSGTSDEDWSSQVIDHASFRLLGRLLGPESKSAAMDFLGETSTSKAWVRADQLCVLLTRFPEANLR